jgi:hypothetical protein
MSTQEADGHWPQNMWLDGSPYWSGIQMDETAFPILLVDLALREKALGPNHPDVAASLDGLAELYWAKREDAHAEPLLCAGLIGYRAHRLAGPGPRLGLYGFGAAAHVLVQLAVHERREVYAFTSPGDTVAQRLARVEIPIAVPVIVAGIRIAVVINIGVTAIAAYIGAGSTTHSR